MRFAGVGAHLACRSQGQVDDCIRTIEREGVRERRTAGNPSDRLAYEICVNPGKLAPAKDPTGHQRWQELPQAARRPPKLADEGPDATVRNPEIARFHDNLENSGSP